MLKKEDRLMDFYYSRTMQKNKMALDCADEKPIVCYVSINGETLIFSEQIEHGKKPSGNIKDYILLGTTNESNTSYGKISDKLRRMEKPVNKLDRFEFPDYGEYTAGHVDYAHGSC